MTLLLAPSGVVLLAPLLVDDVAGGIAVGGDANLNAFGDQGELRWFRLKGHCLDLGPAEGSSPLCTLDASNSQDTPHILG